MTVVTLLVLLAHLSKAAVGGVDEQESEIQTANGGIPTADRQTEDDHFQSQRKRFNAEDRAFDSQQKRTRSGDEFDTSSTSDGGPTSPRVRESPLEGSLAGRETDGVQSMSPGTLLANVALSQGLLGALLLGGAWYAEIPLAAFGVVPGVASSTGLSALGMAIALGIVLYVGNELLGKAVDGFGIDYSEGLREMLAPETLGGWFVLLVLVLPIIAGFEEFLFRAALVGALNAGFGISPWLLAILSSVLFAAGHGAQGQGGIFVTGLLGFALAAAFVLTGSLLVVVVAHYLVNALEFVVHEGLGWDPF